MMRGLFILSLSFLVGCYSPKIVSKEEVIRPMTYKMEDNTEIDGFFVSQYMMMKFIKIKRELDYYHELENKGLIHY